MSGRLPALLRAALCLERATARLQGAAAALAQVVALRAVARARRPDVTSRIYDGQTHYRAGGFYFEQGLFDWERQLVADPRFPAHGRVLVGAAGGGREAAALAGRGLEVVAFEPSPVLASHAVDVLAPFAGAAVVCGSYADLIAAVAGEPSPLRSVVERAPYAAVVLGWTSVSYLLDAGALGLLLRGLRRLSPDGPVALSYVAPFVQSGGHARSKRWGIREADQAIWFSAHGGYVRGFARDEVRASAEEAGYEIAVDEQTPVPHALLVPGAAEPARSPIRAAAASRGS